jgi:hypothetical protein
MRNFIKEQEFHSEVLGFDLSEVEQGTDQWQRSRAGVVTASKASILLIKDARAPFPEDLEVIKDGKMNTVVFEGEEFSSTRKVDCTDWVRNQLPPLKSEMKMTYINELVAAVATELLPEEISAKPLAWGKEYEKEANQAYSGQTFEVIDDIGFIYQNDSMRAGISPDGLVRGKEKGLELKCPWSSSIFIGFASRGDIKKEEFIQCQFSMLVTGFKSWGFAKYDPRMKNCKKLHFIEIERDEEMIANLQQGLDDLLDDMDEALSVMGLEFGQQWGSSDD